VKVRKEIKNKGKSCQLPLQVRTPVAYVAFRRTRRYQGQYAMYGRACGGTGAGFHKVIDIHKSLMGDLNLKGSGQKRR